MSDQPRNPAEAQADELDRLHARGWTGGDQQAQELPSQDYVRDGLSAAAILAARAPVPVERPDEPTGTPDESDVRFPVKLNDAYTCQGRDRDGEAVTFNDLLSEGDRVASVTDEDGNHFAPFGVVVRREDGLWVELEPPTDGREHR